MTVLAEIIIYISIMPLHPGQNPIRFTEQQKSRCASFAATPAEAVIPAPTLEADRLIYRVRETLAGLFNISDPARIIFTLNATDALNIAMKGFLQTGDHVLYTAMEHNSGA